MKSTQELFKEHCEPKFDKFMEAIYVNPKGEVELKFWQERVVNSFLAKHACLNLDANGLLMLIRDGTEMRYICPEDECGGDVICINRASDEWGCCECGVVWSPKSVLVDAINEAELR